MAANPILQTLYGWTSNEPVPPGRYQYILMFHLLTSTAGTVKLETMKRGLDRVLLPRITLSWSATYAAAALNTVKRNPTTTWHQCRYSVAVSQEQCVVGSWVFAKSPLVVRSTYICKVQTLIVLWCHPGSNWPHHWTDH